MRLSGLVWVSIVIGCGGSSTAPGAESSGSSGSSSSSGAQTTSASSSTGPDESSSTWASDATETGSESTSVESSTSSGSSTGGSSDGSSSDDSSSSGDEPHVACTDGCAVEFMCGTQWDSAEACSEWCEDNLDKAALFSPFCAGAWEQLSACFATLDCEQFAAYQAAKMFPYPCSDEADALAFECEGQ